MPVHSGPPAEMLKALETAPNMYLVLSPDLFIITASDAYLKATATTREALAGRHIFEAFPDNPDLPDGDDGMQNIKASLENVLRTKKPDLMRIQRYDVPDVEHPGKFITRYWDPSHTPVLDEQGEISYIIQLATNVTERVLTEQAVTQLTGNNEELAAVNLKLRVAQQKIDESETALRLAINAANFGTWFIHSVTREFITDARLKELFGYDVEEDLSIEQALAQITEEYRGFVATKLENAIYHNGDYDVTYPVIGLHDQKLRWLRAIGNLKADPSGAFSAFTGLVMDITESYLAAKTVERTEENLRMAVDAAGLGTFSINAADRVFTASAKLKEIFGFRPDEEVPYEAATDQIQAEYRQQVIDAVEATFNEGVRFDMEYPIIGYHDETVRWVRAIGEMQHSEGQDCFTGVLHEITEKRQDELRKNDFIGMVSHELKTPLTSLTAIVQVANQKLKNSEDAFLAGAMEKASVQVRRMSTMINGFLNVSRLESAKLVIDKQEFDLEGLIVETIRDTELTVSSHTIHYIPCQPVIVAADRDKIGSVVTNLISNAVKYSPKGKLITIKCEVIDDNALVSVKDEGMGIKATELEKVFDRYYRVQTDHTQHISGFGIGLYLSAEIIRRHGGRIWVESEQDTGSTFFFTLPVAIAKT